MTSVRGRHGVAVSDVAGAAAFCVLLAPLAARTAGAVSDAGDVGLLLLAVGLGFLATDLTSGIVHWVCDTFFAEDTPVLGPALIRPFREHHRDPLAMTRHGFLRVNRSCFLGMSAVLAVAWWRQGTGPERSGALFADAWLLGYACAVVLTNQFHMWAHAARRPAAVRWLQAACVVIAPARHARHHDEGGTRAFCITTGWLNPLLDGLGVFHRIEGLLEALRRRAARGPAAAGHA